MGPSSGSFSECLKCNTYIDIDLINCEKGCENCDTTLAEALGVDESFISTIVQFCKEECANLSFALEYCSAQLSSASHLSRMSAEYKEKVFLGASDEVLLRVNLSTLREGLRCTQCDKYLTGHPVSERVCRLCVTKASLVLDNPKTMH